MKAIIMDRHGGPDVLRYGDLPDPMAEAGQVVVDVHAASINGADAKVLEGGAYATSGCARANAVGGCRQGSGVGCATTWYYASSEVTAEQVRGICTQAGGVIVSP